VEPIASQEISWLLDEAMGDEVAGNANTRRVSMRDSKNL